MGSYSSPPPRSLLLIVAVLLTLRNRAAHPSSLYMRTWSLSEMEACRRLLYDHVESAIAANRFTDLGGVIRFVLVTTGIDSKVLVRTALNQAEVQELLRAMGKADSHET